MNYLGWLETIASGNGRPSRVRHLQDNDYMYEEDYEGSAEESSPYEGCEYFLTEFAGEIVSPNWPKKYPSKKKCHWTILAPEEHHVELQFENFKVEYHKSCRMDRVEVHHDGHGYYLCGAGTPRKKFISTEQTMELYFQSDEAQNFGGFKAHYQIVPNKKNFGDKPPFPRAFSIAEVEEENKIDEGICGRPKIAPNRMLRILGGQPIKHGQWPWLGMLLEEVSIQSQFL